MRSKIILFILFAAQQITAFAQPAEKMLLTTDKQWYYPGENMWFAVNTFKACGDSLAQISSVAYIELVGSDGKAVFQSKVAIEDAQGKGVIEIDESFPSGNYVVLAYTSWMKNFGPGSFARKPVFIVNPERPGAMNTAYTLPESSNESGNAFTLNIPKKQYAKREPVNLSFSVPGAERASVSVYKKFGLEKTDEKVYMSHLSDPCTTAPPRPAPFIFENRGQVVTGKVTDVNTQKPAAGVRGYLSSVNHPAKLWTALSDSAGVIRFPVANISGKTELIIQTDTSTHNKYTVELLTSFASNAGGFTTNGNENIFDSRGNIIDEAMMGIQVQKTFAEPDTFQMLPDTTEREPFYIRPDAFYLMNDYVHFGSVEEILREIVTNVNVRKRRGKLYPVVLNVYTREPYSEPPLTVVNGIPVFDMERFLQINTEDIYSVSVVARKFNLGSKSFYGVIDIRLKNTFKDIGTNARVMDYDGIELPKEFTAPDYSTDSKRLSRKPDFRNVLYWNPSVKTDVNGNGSIEFYTSDFEGEYMVVVEGIGPDGKVSLQTTSIEVK